MIKDEIYETLAAGGCWWFTNLPRLLSTLFSRNWLRESENNSKIRQFENCAIPAPGLRAPRDRVGRHHHRAVSHLDSLRRMSGTHVRADEVEIAPETLEALQSTDKCAWQTRWARHKKDT